MTEQTDAAEPRYTLREAQREMALRECANFGHSWQIISVEFGKPVQIICDSCGWSGSVAMGDRPSPRVPSTSEGEGA